LNILIKHQQLLNNQERELRQDIDELLHKSSIIVNQQIFCGCKIQFGERNYQIEKDMRSTTFKLQDGTITY